MHTHAQIETMCGVTLGSRIEMDLITTQAHGLLEDPTQESNGVAAVAGFGERDEVVNVGEVAPGQVVARPEAAGRRGLPLVIERSRQPITFRTLELVDASGEPLGRARPPLKGSNGMHRRCNGDLHLLIF